MNFGQDVNTMYRKDSVDTSIEAAKTVDTPRLEKLVYETVKQYGEEGCIQDDVLNDLSHLGYSTVTARFAPLLKKGYIVDTGDRRIGKSGRGQRVIKAVEVELVKDKSIWHPYSVDDVLKDVDLNEPLPEEEKEDTLYTLTKISDKGFELKTTHPEILRVVLHNFICKQCCEEFSSNYTGIRHIEDILASPCGAEFILEEEE